MTAISAVSTNGNVKVAWVNLGEGLCGDYDPNDPDDRHLLRFDTYIAETAAGRTNCEPSDQEGWLTANDGSYCTLVDAKTDQQTLKILAEKMAETLSVALDNGSFSRAAQTLSWFPLNVDTTA